MSAEALIRGAKSVVAIEQSGAVCQVLKKNLQKVCPVQRSPDPKWPIPSWQVMQGDVLKVLGKLQPQKFDLVYFDPPYASALYLPVLERLGTFIDGDSRVAAEHDIQRPLPDRIDQLTKYDLRQYGHTALSFYCLD